MSDEYLVLGTKVQYRGCGHIDDLDDRVVLESADNLCSSCPRCDPGPHSDQPSVRRGQQPIGVVVDTIEAPTEQAMMADGGDADA